jgi:acetolactate synthase I/II/III large subunit
MIRVADYIARRIADYGVRHMFMVSGGGAMHLNDAFGTAPGLTYVCNHHEQACAIAAEGYARAIDGLGVVCVTSGPGGTNTLTGVLGMWLDSIPGLFVSGQVKFTTTVASTGLPLRQLGDQEANIVEIVRSVTKYAVMVTDARTIRWHLEKALHLATTGRPGPVWLDIPLDVQSAMVDPEQLERFDPSSEAPLFDASSLPGTVSQILERLRNAKRPLIIAGGGIRSSKSIELFRSVIERLNVPVQTAITAIDLVESDHRLFAGRPGVAGDRSSNFILQNCDLLLSIGSRLWVRMISYNFDAFARDAYKIAVDIDAAELAKPTLQLDLPVHADAGAFLRELSEQLGDQVLPPREQWLEWCEERKRRYPVVLPEYRSETGYVNSYVFVDALSSLLASDDCVVTGDGTAYTGTWQAITIKRGQRVFTNSGCAAMGYDLPAAIGACFARDKRRVICITGDGSIQMNLQELQTIVHHRLPIKIFVLNNNGYLAIRMTQDAYFGSRYVASDPSSGVSCPDMLAVAAAYGIPARRVSTMDALEQELAGALEADGPSICEIMMSPAQPLIPKLASEVMPDGRMISKPLEDMYPFLDRREFAENMLIEPWDPAKKK